MASTSERDLYVRGAATLVASWEQYARGCSGAAVLRLDGVAAAVFPSGPERAVFNNALLDRDLGPERRAAAVDQMIAAYRSAGVDRYAAWVHESDEAMRAELSRRGYTVEESTRAMAMSLDGLTLADPGALVERSQWAEHVEYLQAVGAPAGLLAGIDPSAFEVLGASLDGVSVATGIAFDHEGDRGIFNLGTLDAARRRGLGTAITTRLVLDGAARGCTTASLQSTSVAERVYAAAGFRDLGRILEYVP